MAAELVGAIIDAAGNLVLRAMTSIVLDRTHLLRRLDLDTPDRVVAIRLRHRGLAAAAVSQHAATANAIPGEHLIERRRRLPQLMPRAEAVVDAANYP